MDDELKMVIEPNESILYTGKPSIKCYIFESIFNPLLPFSIFWCFFDVYLFGDMFFSSNSGMSFFTLIFFIIHMMPVWMYLSGILFVIRRYRNTFYVVTDKAIYISEGSFVKTINSKPFAEMSHINLRRGVFDRIFNVGDIVIAPNCVSRKKQHDEIIIASISNYNEVYNIVKKLQTDIYSDIMYPNDKRPNENPGYNTKYKGL